MRLARPARRRDAGCKRHTRAASGTRGLRAVGMVLAGHAYCVAGRPLGAAVQARVRPLGAGVYLQGTQAVNRRPHIHQARTHQKRGVSLTQGIQSDVVEPLSHLRKCLR